MASGLNLNGSIFKVAGPLVVAGNMSGSRMFEVVKVGKDKLVGEIIRKFLFTNTIFVFNYLNYFNHFNYFKYNNQNTDLCFKNSRSI